MLFKRHAPTGASRKPPRSPPRPRRGGALRAPQERPAEADTGSPMFGRFAASRQSPAPTRPRRTPPPIHPQLRVSRPVTGDSVLSSGHRGAALRAARASSGALCLTHPAADPRPRFRTRFSGNSRQRMPHSGTSISKVAANQHLGPSIGASSWAAAQDHTGPGSWLRRTSALNLAEFFVRRFRQAFS